VRIVMVAACPFPSPRGTPVRIHRLAEALARRGHSIHVVTYHLGDKTASLPFVVHRIRDISGYTDCSPGPTWRKLLQLDPLLIGVLKQLLHSMPFDIIHAHHYEGLLAALLCGSPRPPIIYDAHTLLASELPFYRLGVPRRIKASIGRLFDQWLPPRADHVIAVTDSICAAFTADGRLDSQRVTVIPNGVESEHFAAAATMPLTQHSHKRLIFAGNLAAYQGVEPMLQAFALVHRRRCDVRLVLLTASSFASYAPLADALGIRSSIEILNPDFDALAGCLRSADVLLNPRQSCAGLPQKLLNYMAAGRPTVSFAGAAKIIEHECTGLVVPDGDVQAFADAMMHLLSRPELGIRLGTNAQRFVATQFGWHQQAVKVEAVYEGVLADRTSRRST
jgi:glycosyltransferase involved in cell wall biosynthesis